MHRKEAKEYIVFAKTQYPKSKFRIRRYWVLEPAHKFKATRPERAK
jgi:hypothetical protein